MTPPRSQSHDPWHHQGVKLTTHDTTKSISRPMTPLSQTHDTTHVVPSSLLLYVCRSSQACLQLVARRQQHHRLLWASCRHCQVRHWVPLEHRKLDGRTKRPWLSAVWRSVRQSGRRRQFVDYHRQQNVRSLLSFLITSESAVVIK